jgi:transcriptional regulator with XRE-family HTH domain
VFPGATLDGVRHHPDARTMLDINTLAARIVARRAELRLEQTEVAERANRSRAYISRLEGALVPNPKLFDLAAVAVALEMTLSELVAPEAKLVETRFSHEWAEIQQQTEHLPPEIREQVLRGFRESVALLNAASSLARRN